MVASFLVGAGTTLIPVIQIPDFGVRLVVTSLVSVAVWLPVMLLTAPEKDERLDAFYRKVRPGGPGWRRQRERTGLEPAMELGRDVRRVVAALLLVFGLMFGVGAVVLLRWGVLGGSAVAAVVGGLWLRGLERPPQARRATVGVP